MDAWWTWLAVAGAGALHGANPATGWPLVASRGARAGAGGSTWRALLPMAGGHAVSVAVVAGAAALGVAVQRGTLIASAAAVLAVIVVGAACRRRGARRRGPAVPLAPAGLALWSFAMATLQGAGLMLVPALMPLCLGDGALATAAGTGPLATALAVVGVHLAAMLAATGALAAGARRLAAGRGRRGAARRSAACVGDAIAVARAPRSLEVQLDVGLARSDRGDRLLDLLGRGVELLGPAPLLFGRGHGGGVGRGGHDRLQR